MKYDLSDEKAKLTELVSEIAKHLEAVREAVESFNPSDSNVTELRLANSKIKQLRNLDRELRDFGDLDCSSLTEEYWSEEPIWYLDLSTRTVNVLERFNIKTVDQLQEKMENPAGLSELPGLGKKAIFEIQRALTDFQKNAKSIILGKSKHW